MKHYKVKVKAVEPGDEGEAEIWISAKSKPKPGQVMTRKDGMTFKVISAKRGRMKAKGAPSG